MSNFESASTFSPMAQWRSLEDDLSSSPPPPMTIHTGFDGQVFRSLAPLELGAPIPQPFSSKELGNAEGDFSLGIQPTKADSFGMLGLLPRSAPTVADLPLVPAWVCMHTSFVIRLPPASAFAKILDILRSPTFGITVDVQPQNDKFQMKGKGYRDEAMTYFKKKLFRNSANEIVVECIRQDGCVVLFNKMYQKLLAALGDEAHRLVETGLKASPVSPDLQPFPPPPSLSSSSEACSASILHTLLQRAASRLLDEQFQACQALVTASSAESAAASWRELGDADIIAIVTLLLSSESEDTAHLATVLLLNLFKMEFKIVSSALISALFALLDSPPTFQNQDTKRQVSSSLRMIVESRKQTFSVPQRQTLEFYEKSSDPVLRVNACAILQHVC
jgi:hypothetical protein